METTSRRTPSVSSPGQARHALVIAPRRHELRAAGAETLLTAAGSGQYRYAGLAVTRWLDDPTCDNDGIYVYLRDLDSGRFWSAGFQPTAAEPESYDVAFASHRAAYRRTDAGIHMQLDVRLCPVTGAELRRCTLTNASKRPRTIELTSYLEWVLQHAEADAAHPAFSKLFVETEFVDSRRLIIARRRSRDPRDATLIGGHWIVEPPGTYREPTPAIQFETDRARFVGRGRNLRDPAALASWDALSGTQGPVLDPIASLRLDFYLPPNESASITFAVAARSELETLLDAVRSLTSRRVDDLFRNDSEPTSRDGGASPSNVRFDPPHLASRSSEIISSRLLDAEQRTTLAPSRDAEQEQLRFDNGIGGFSADGREYVIRLRPDAEGRLPLPPMPWSHVVASPHAGFLTTETGAGCTWTVNSRENRLTAWSNDPVSDPPSEAVFLRDRNRRAFWSLTPGPCGPTTVHEIRYGFGYARYEHSSAGLRQSLLQFVPIADAVKIIDVSTQNDGDVPRDLDLFFYARLALGNGDRKQRKIRTWFDAASGAVFAANPARELSSRVSFAVVVTPGGRHPRSYTGDRGEFLGPYGDLAAPAAVRASDRLSDRVGDGLDACFAIQATLQLPARCDLRCWVLLGEADDETAARRMIERYAKAADVDAAFDRVRQHWQELLSAVEVEAPSPALTIMVNGWLPYQNISCRLWGRSAYYQSGGAFGFRDQLQDSAALVYHRPDFTREQILRHAAAQFVEGDVLHWWHPPSARGIRTRFADDLLWLPLVAAEYVATTGDESLWDASAPYLAAPALEPGAAEHYGLSSPSGVWGTIYEHACRAIDRSLSVGAHGLPLIGCGDWNDGMNRVGAAGAGESVWMAFFLDVVLQRMLPVCEARRDDDRLAAYRAHQARLREDINQHGWDGAWFRRAYFDDGAPLGTAAADECQIDALVQAWSVLSGAADPECARQAVDAVERRLVRDDSRLIQLLDPPFDHMAHDPGYIKGYLPGIRENGGQYTHGVLWFIRALAELGRGSRAVELLDMLNPIHHARTREEVATYQVEPYVVAADVYSQPPHVGRGGWTWYTGSAGWMWRVAVESILGLQVRGGRELVLNPCIAAFWPSCRVKYRMPSGELYEITIENPDRRETGVRFAACDERPVAVENGVARVPLVGDGNPHCVRLQL
jgi:cyclic beta-1,2-glucan synthetase